MRADRFCTDHVDAELVTNLPRLGVEIVDDFDVVGDETNWHDNEIFCGVLTRKFFNRVAEVRFDLRLRVPAAYPVTVAHHAAGTAALVPMTRPISWRLAPSVNKDLTSNSSETVASAASIFATRD